MFVDECMYYSNTRTDLTCSPQNATLAGYPTDPLPNETNITLMCSAYNPTTSSLMYSWFANGEPLVGENRSSLDIHVRENLTIVCTVRNDVGVASVSANITVVEGWECVWCQTHCLFKCLLHYFLLGNSKYVHYHSNGPIVPISIPGSFCCYSHYHPFIFRS